MIVSGGSLFCGRYFMRRHVLRAIRLLYRPHAVAGVHSSSSAYNRPYTKAGAWSAMLFRVMTVQFQSLAVVVQSKEPCIR